MKASAASKEYDLSRGTWRISSPGAALPGAAWALAVLLSANLLNYLDRQVLYALLPLIKSDMRLTDTQLGALASAFMLVYMCAAVPVGYWADRSNRSSWIAWGLLGWSLATLGSGLSATYRQLFSSRAAVGIGESCYGSVSPSFVAEHFPEGRRAGMLAIFSLAIPVGSALGYLLGGFIGYRWGWRQALCIAGTPGMILAWFAYRLRDPRRSASSTENTPPLREYIRLGRNRSFVSCTLAMAAMTFGLGGFAVWMPTFFTRTWGLNVAQAGALFGTVTVLSGLAGSLAGGWISDRTYKVTDKAYFLVSGIGLVLALPLGCAALVAADIRHAMAALFLAEFCAFLNMGPLNALIVQVTDVRVRSMAFAANIFVIHALGDALSPTIIGRLSDLAGLRIGLLSAATMLGLAGLICFWGMRYVRSDIRSMEAAHA